MIEVERFQRIVSANTVPRGFGTQLGAPGGLLGVEPPLAVNRFDERVMIGFSNNVKSFRHENKGS